MNKEEQADAFHKAVIDGMGYGNFNLACEVVVDALNEAGYVIEPNSTNPLTVAEAEALLEEAIARRDADNEHTILAAFTVKAPSWEQAQRRLMRWFGPLTTTMTESSGITSWWIAEDVRYDGSDNDSAQFVPGSGAHHWPANSLRGDR